MIAIKDMEMPRNCLECDFENNNLMCDLLHWKVGDTEKTRLDGRLPNCPLIEVDDPTPRRVLNSKGGKFTAENWDGCRLTRYKCPKCLKYVRNGETYCHKCGQHLMFPKNNFTPYVKGQRQDTIVTWADEPTMEEYMSDQDRGDPEDGRL
ncbi:MAG: hypothetical protein IJ680_06690 [Paludibacteraceae bacterium]|nr:hypothetical protein [Paludibacteraceae bacterium]